MTLAAASMPAGDAALRGLATSLTSRDFSTTVSGGELFPLAVREFNRLIDQSAELDLDAGIAAEIDASERLFNSDDMLEGLRAFFDKQPAKYRGT